MTGALRTGDASHRGRGDTEPMRRGEEHDDWHGLYRIGPRVRQTVRKPLGTVNVWPWMKNEATPGNSGNVIV
jgi:hypothetical protein